MDNEHYIAHLREEANYEIARLEALLRDPRMTANDREIALNMLSFYRDARNEDGQKSELSSAHSSKVPEKQHKQHGDCPKPRVRKKAA